jgi:hypothetical protein
MPDSDLDTIARQIREQTRGSITEATVRIRTERILALSLAARGIVYAPVHEQRTAVSGQRTDTLFGTVIIEYKKPNALSSPAQWTHACSQLEGYLRNEAQRTGLDRTLYAGILIDGQNIGFIRSLGQEWQRRGPLSVNGGTVRLLLEYLRGLSRKPSIPLPLARSSGHNQISLDNASRCCGNRWTFPEKELRSYSSGTT